MAEQAKNGFTLIELLIVIAVIGILAALLLPVLAASRRKAQALECVSNLRQIGALTMMYCNENDDYLPFAWYNESNPEINSFYSLLTPIMLREDFDGYSDFDNKVYTCPIRAREPLVGPNPMRISYGMNAFNAVNFPEPRTRHLGQVSCPTARVLAADLAYLYNHPPLQTVGPDQVGYKHDKKANMLFFDGHVTRHLLAETNALLLDFQ